MTAAAGTPWVMRDRLLQAIDGQGNVRNMVVVVEVISSLENYPVTKEVLEETRLGKLINDIRKKTKNEDLAKTAKKLLRNWQKLIDPGQGGSLSKGLTGASWSSKGSPHPCCSPAAAPPALRIPGPELKARSDFNNCSPKPEQMSNRKHRRDTKEGPLLQTKKPKVTHDDAVQHAKPLPTDGAANTHTHQPLDRDTSNCLENNKPNKVPVHAVKPHPSASVYSNPPSSLMGRQVGWDKPKSPCCPLQHPETPKQEAGIKKAVSKTQSCGSPGMKARTEDVVQTNLEFGSRTRSTSLPDSRCDSVHLAGGNTINYPGKNKSEKCGAKDYVVNPAGPVGEDRSRPARLKDRITFDPSTGQIRLACPKDFLEEQEFCQQVKPHPAVPSGPIQQTDWKELSRSEIIQSYLTQQSNILLSSGVHTPGGHFFTSEVSRRMDQRNSSATETHTLASHHLAKELPGISREISNEDLSRLQRQRWPGVNGCYDTKGDWYDWTQCISLDPHGDESRLNILPYVCLD